MGSKCIHVQLIPPKLQIILTKLILIHKMLPTKYITQYIPHYFFNSHHNKR